MSTSLMMKKTEVHIPAMTNHKIRSGGDIDIDPLDATFRDNNRAPLHSWFPYLEGYSPRFVKGVMLEYLPNAKRILEPFAGSGTTPIVLGQLGVECAYSEVNPVMVFVIKAKLDILSMKAETRERLSGSLSALSLEIRERSHLAKPDVDLRKAYSASFGNSVFFEDTVFEDVLRLRTLVDEIYVEDEQLGRCVELAVLSSLIVSSRLKRAGDLRFKNQKELDAKTRCVLKSVSERLASQAADIVIAGELCGTTASFACNNADGLRDSVKGSWDGVITSPPYLNGTNYIRNARLELWFRREINSKGGLRSFRDNMITSGINDVNAQTDWRPVTDSVAQVVLKLEENAYDQRIPKMVGGYFRDMRAVMRSLSSSVSKNGRICVDIGDSIYAGVHVPTDDLLVEVAESIGLKTVERVHLRKRTSNGGQPIRQQLLVFEK